MREVSAFANTWDCPGQRSAGGPLARVVSSSLRHWTQKKPALRN